MQDTQDILIDFISTMTVSEFAERAGVTVIDLVDLTRRYTGASQVLEAKKAASKAKTTKKAKAPKKPAPKTKKVDVSTPAGRAAYDDVIANAIVAAKDWINAEGIRKLTPGTSKQRRASLNRLVEGGRIKYKGQARGTKYIATGK